MNTEDNNQVKGNTNGDSNNKYGVIAIIIFIIMCILADKVPGLFVLFLVLLLIYGTYYFTKKMFK